MTAPSVVAVDGTGHLVALIRAASLAPSSHNTQPWRFRLDGHVIDVLADRTRALPVNDPYDRELTISCGCALLNLRVAAAGERLEARVSLLPDAADADHLARVQLRPAVMPHPVGDLQVAMRDRRTCRGRFAAMAIAPETARALAEAAAAEGAVLSVLESNDQRHRGAALVAAGNAAQWADPSWRRELAAWMRARRCGDGLTLPAMALPFVPRVVRRFDLGRAVAASDRRRTEESPLLAVLSTSGDQPPDWLAAGQALQRLLLVGVQHGLQASYLNQPIQVPALRPEVQQLTGRPGFAQLLVRMGSVTAPPPATPRRPLSDVIASA